MADLFPHKSGWGMMEPVALINHNVCILYGSVRHYRKVQYFEPIPPFQCLDIAVATGAAIGAATTTGRIAAPLLDLFDSEFGQYRWYPIDNAQIRLWLPQVDGRYSIRNIQIPVGMEILDRDPDLHFTEFYVWEDRHPFFEAMNFMDYDLDQCRIIAQGFRFVTEELSKPIIARIEAGEVACTYVVASGWAGSTR